MNAYKTPSELVADSTAKLEAAERAEMNAAPEFKKAATINRQFASGVLAYHKSFIDRWAE